VGPHLASEFGTDLRGAGAPVGTEAALKNRIAEDSFPTELDVVIRRYSADELKFEMTCAKRPSC
jgi:hypothetical protein